jgi:hypothetical protein
MSSYFRNVCLGYSEGTLWPPYSTGFLSQEGNNTCLVVSWKYHIWHKVLRWLALNGNELLVSSTLFNMLDTMYDEERFRRWRL